MLQKVAPEKGAPESSKSSPRKKEKKIPLDMSGHEN